MSSQLPDSQLPNVDLADAQLPDDVLRALRARRKIDAIKLLREARSIGLKEAREAIESYLAGHPELVSRTPVTEGVSFTSVLIIGVFLVLLYGLYKLFIGPAA